ncbi:helix-turn-helix transcriptional regulator [Mariprofundus erugo]|uniref:Helix-turn-helix transcriptional regulator n=1 Tax=Mariprofundus erugo TaxID=2528639 RepID=A0A5R9GJS7_9PROT|nr:helix-turn-helix transcriptional regulator [Mariprofundus erugo]TLS65475.1 helix-turn-helix transcriptional regulator [Mariprofundus erugo]
MRVRLFNRLIKEIYSLCLNNGKLQAVLRDLASYCNCKSAAIEVINLSNMHAFCQWCDGLGESETYRYVNFFAGFKPWLPGILRIEASGCGGEIYLYRGDEPVRIEAGGTQWLTPAPGELVGILFREGDFLIHFVIMADEDRSADGSTILQAVSLIFPHVNEAFRIFHELETLRNYSKGFEQTMDHLSSGILLFDGESRVCYQNRQAHHDLASTSLCSVVAGQLYGASPESTRRLRDMVVQAIEHGRLGRKKLGMMTLQHGFSEDPQLALVAIPLHPDVLSMLEERMGIYAAILIGRTDRNSRINPEVLQLLYGLTQSEARLAVCLADGRTLDQYCTDHGIRLSTARGYLKLIFQKTDTKRQAELVALLRGVPVVASHQVCP